MPTRISKDRKKVTRIHRTSSSCKVSKRSPQSLPKQSHLFWNSGHCIALALADATSSTVDCPFSQCLWTASATDVIGCLEISKFDLRANKEVGGKTLSGIVKDIFDRFLCGINWTLGKLIDDQVDILKSDQKTPYPVIGEKDECTDSSYTGIHVNLNVPTSSLTLPLFRKARY